MSMYFAKQIAPSYSLKNKLQKDFRKFCLANDRQLLCSDYEKEAFIARLKHELAKLELKHKRCKDLNWRDDNYGFEDKDENRYVGVTNVGLFAIYEVSRPIGQGGLS